MKRVKGLELHRKITMKQTTGFRILSLPDEILTVIFQCLSRRSDRLNLALTCSRFHHLIKQARLSLFLTIHSSPLELVERLTRLFNAGYTCVTSLVISGESFSLDSRSQKCSINLEDIACLLSTIASTCPKLESLRTYGLDYLEESVWRKLGEGCRLLSTLGVYFTSPPATYPPFDIFRSLESLSLDLDGLSSHIPSLSLCSSLSSLALWNVNDLQLSKLASSSPLPSLRSLTLHRALLTRSLSYLASFSNLSSLSFDSCMRLDVDDMQVIACSLHCLTQLTLQECFLISSSGVAAVVESNPNLTTPSLQEGSCLLFSPSRFKALLACCRQLSTLNLSRGLVLHPSLIADCSSLQSLSINNGSGSLESLAGMLLRVEKASTDGGNSMRQEKAGNGEGARQRGARCSKVVNKALIWGRRGHLVRVAAAAARQNTVLALKQWHELHGECSRFHGSLRQDLLDSIHVLENGGVTGSIGEAHSTAAHFSMKISACNLVKQVRAEAVAALEGEETVKRIISYAEDSSAFIVRPGEAVRAAESMAVPVGTAAAGSVLRQGSAAEEGPGWPLVDGNDATGSDPEGNFEAILVSMRAMSRQLEAVDQALRDPAPVLVPGPTSPDFDLSSSLRVEAHGISNPGEAVAVNFAGPLLRSLTLNGFQFTPSTEPAWLQEAFHQQPNSSFPDASSSSSSNTPSVTSSLKLYKSVHSIIYAAAFEGLQRLSLEGCSGLDEDDLAALFNACQGLLHLTMDRNKDFSDGVIAGVKLPFLSSLSMLSCKNVSAAGVDGLLRSFPRVVQVKVEQGKVTKRTSRALSRACVFVMSE